METKQLFEILIPVTSNIGDMKSFDGIHQPNGDFTISHHRDFEKFALGKVGGMSKLPEISGVWIDEGKIYAEKMIPYRFACTSQEIDVIAVFAKKHYKQLAIFVAEIGTARFY